MKEKIIFITKALWFGGIETALVNLLQYFNYDRYDVTLLVLQADLQMMDRVPGRCRVQIIDRDHRAGTDRPYPYSRLFHLTEETANPSAFHRAMLWTVPAIKAAENRLFISHVRKTMAREHFRTAIIFSDVVGEIAVRAVQADRYLMYYHHGAMRRVWHDEAAYQRVNHVIAVSDSQAASLRRFIPAYANKIRVIHNMIDIRTIRDMGSRQPEETFDSSSFHIVTVGRVSSEKGMDLAVRTCRELVEKGNSGIRWWIIGGGPAEAEVRALIEETGMGAYIHMTGMKENPYPYMRRADLYVQPSRFEGYPMTVLEAQILGQPVISTDNPGAAEIIKDKVTGILCAPDRMADVIGELLHNPGQLEQMKLNTAGLDFEKENRISLRRLEKLL